MKTVSKKRANKCDDQKCRRKQIDRISFSRFFHTQPFSATYDNKTEDVLKNIDIKISFNPEIAKDYEYHIDEILGEQSVEISPVKLNINTEYLFSLTEKMVGNITIEVFQGDNKIFSNDESIEILAFDEWSGLLFMPEIIAAFVTPNHPKISEVLREAAVLLKKWTGSPSFTGYQTRNPNNVKLQMAAIYEALQKTGHYNKNPTTKQRSNRAKN